MRVVQLIDSLQTGGAERMAVNFANGLASEIAFSGLVATRCEGSLRNQLGSDVNYLFLNKQKALDIQALFQLRKYLITNKIDIVHAHSSSFFYAVLVKFLGVNCKVVWHDHNGNRAALLGKQNKIIILFSRFFSGAIACSTTLKEWSIQNLKTAKVTYIPNFASVPEKEEQVTFLEGESGKRIVCLANLRDPKNHSTLLRAFAEVVTNNPGWTLHCIGNDYKDAYSDALKKQVEALQLQDKVFIYGGRSDIFSILRQCDIGVLLSTYEGFPVTLLEYGMAKLSVLTTNVGYCSNVVEDGFSGFLTDPLDTNEIVTKMENLIKDKPQRVAFAENLHTFVINNFSQEAVVKKTIAFYKSL